MKTGRKQHAVPQMMIRRFAGDDGKLAELIKPELEISVGRKSPKVILFGEDFYRDQCSDLDAEMITPIEQRFAHIYPSLADDAHPHMNCGKKGAALIDWIASMLVRTRAFGLLTEAVGQKDSPLGQLLWKMLPDLLRNVGRVSWFSELQDLLTRPLIRWKLKTYPAEETVVLTDFPVFQTSGSEPGGQVTIVPLTKHRVMFGGSEKALAHWNIPSVELNAILAAYAERFIFAADRATLERVARQLRGDEGHSPDWCAAARRPFFGFLDRLNDMSAPNDSEVSRWFHECKESYGGSILPQRNIRKRN